MKKNLTFLFLLTALYTFGQDGAWTAIKVDENMEISLPGKVQRIDTTISKEGRTQTLHVLKSSTENSTLGVSITPVTSDKVITNSPELLKKAINDVADGFCASASKSNLSCTANDILVDNLQGKKTVVQDKDRKIEFTNYIFIIDKKLYLISYNLKSTGTSATALAEQDRLIHSVHFILSEPRN